MATDILKGVPVPDGGTRDLAVTLCDRNPLLGLYRHPLPLAWTYVIFHIPTKREVARGEGEQVVTAAMDALASLDWNFGEKDGLSAADKLKARDIMVAMGLRWGARRAETQGGGDGRTVA